MANDTETLADIVAELRGRADAAFPYDVDTMNMLEPLADRIDAAAKREIPQPAGNAAAIRTALKRLRDASRDFYNQILNSQYSGILDKYTCAKQGFPAVLDVRAAIPAANAALAAAPAVECPPSNVAALHEALGQILYYLPHMLQYMRVHWEDATAGGYYEKIESIAKAALATMEGGAA